MRGIVYALSATAVAAAVIVVPLPYVVYAPGAARPVDELITVADADANVTGELLLTTVNLTEASAGLILLAWLDDDQAVYARPRIIRPGVRTDQYFAEQRDVFQENVTIAAAVGLQLAGEEVSITGTGAQIAEVVPGSPAESVLRPGDVIVEAGGQPVRVAADLSTVTGNAEVGDQLALRVERDGEELDLVVTVGEIDDPPRPGIGVTAQTRAPELELSREVEALDAEIGGPSAGMMVALTVYDLVDDGDLTGGRIVAGTGTIAPDGTVGRIGGIAMKVRGAEAAGAVVFLAPASQAADAEAAAPSTMEVVPVETAQDAIDYLESLSPSR